MTLKSIARKCLLAANELGAGLDRRLEKPNPAGSHSLFILGLPRSGTTLAYEVVVQAFHVAFFSKIYNYTFGMPNLTTRLFSGFTKNPHPRYESEYGSIPGLFTPAENHHFWSAWLPENPQLGHYVPAPSISAADSEEMNSSLGSIGAIAGRPFVFKDVYLTLSLEAVLQRVARSKVLVISRDQQSVAASVYRKRAALGDQPGWWSIRPPFSEQVQKNSLIEQVAFQCIRSEQLLRHQISTADPARCRVVRYADLCKSPHTFVREMKGWLGPAFELRQDPTIPEQFETRPSVGFPEGVDADFARCAESLGADREQYLELVKAASSGDGRSNEHVS